MEIFHEKPDEYIIQYNTNQHEQKIPEKLYASVKWGAWKYNMAHQHKPRWKTDQKRNDESGNMGFKGNKTQMQNLFM
jgi:hypothetical protein